MSLKELSYTQTSVPVGEATAVQRMLHQPRAVTLYRAGKTSAVGLQHSLHGCWPRHTGQQHVPPRGSDYAGPQSPHSPPAGDSADEASPAVTFACEQLQIQHFTNPLA